MLTSRRSPTVAAVRRLQAPSGRREAGAFIAEGPQAVREAVAAGIVQELFATTAGADAHPEFLDGAQTVTMVSDDVLDAMAETRTPQGVLAVCELVASSHMDVAAMRSGAVLLDRVGDPGNAGSIIRTADAAGYGQVILTSGSVDPHNGKVVRASAGSVFHLPVAFDVDPFEAIRAAREADLVIAGTAAVGDVSVQEFAQGLNGRRVAWWLGSEAHGLDPDILDACDVQVHIPIVGAAESLNVAAAGAVCMYAVPLHQGRSEGARP